MAEAYAVALDIAQTRHYLWTLRDRLPMFTITDHPSDWPDFYVAQLSLSLPEPTPLPFAIMDRSLGRLQTTMEALGLTRLTRSPEDDPVIVEVWL